MLTKVRVDVNAEQESKKIFKFAIEFLEDIVQAGISTLDLSRQRIIENHIIPNGAVGHRYTTAKGTTIRRRNKITGREWGRPIFHKSKVVSRTGDFAELFKEGKWIITKTRAIFRGHPDFIAEVMRIGKQTIGTIGVKGSLEKRVAFFEKKGQRKPLSKGLKFGTKRFLTFLIRSTEKTARKFSG